MTEQPTPAEAGLLDGADDAAVAATRRHILLVFAGLMVTKVYDRYSRDNEKRLALDR